jgi:zinc protease
VKLIVEPSRDTPLCWVQILARGGGAADPVGREGFTRHAAELARRGAGGRSRGELDRALDQLGASLSASTTRDRVAFTGVCLSRHLDAVVALAADVLARPAMDAEQHRKLLRESRDLLDEVRDDDSHLALRHFVRDFGGPAAYARTSLGTEASLDAIDLDGARGAYRRMIVPDNLIIGFAGDVDEPRARALADSLVADLPATPAPPAPVLEPRGFAAERAATLVDKPERAQVQIAFGHPAPRFGTADFDALTVVETVFGGTFTSRLMQEIRVAHGWSYGAHCRLGKARGPLWVRVDFASAADVAIDALSRAIAMYEDLVATGITADELAFAQGYLAGSHAFGIATARDRLRVRVEAAVCDLPDAFPGEWPARLAAVTLDDTRRAIETWLHPEALRTVLVATADDVRDRLGAVALGDVDIVPFDAY